MAHVKLHANVPGETSRRYRAGWFRKAFYLWSLLPSDMFSKLNPADRFTEVYFRTFDDEGPIYKIFLEGEQLVMVDCSNSWSYPLTKDEMAKGKLICQEEFFYGNQCTSEVMTIECVSTLTKYDVVDEFLKDTEPAWLVREFYRRREIVGKSLAAVGAVSA